MAAITDMSIKNLYYKFNKILKYFFFSVLSTILDVIIVWIAFHIFNISLTLSNTLGVLSGFFVSYFLSIKTVFNTQHDISSFAIYILTSLIGLVFANYLISAAYAFSIPYCPEWFAFLFSKGVSIVFPFFIMYFMRKYLYILLNNRRQHQWINYMFIFLVTMNLEI